MSDRKAPVLAEPEDVDRRICQLRDALTNEEHVLLRALSYTPRALSCLEWFTDVKRLTQEDMTVRAFSEARDSRSAAELVGEDPRPYCATPLGRCVAINLLANQAMDAVAALGTGPLMSRSARWTARS